MGVTIMKCDDVDGLILLAIAVTILGHIIGFGAELLAQRCERKERFRNERTENALSELLTNFEQRISKLENL
jgi:NhaP-type Na+/H+ or K+/H+ antiporter